MRILGKICGWVAAALLVLQAICVFYGYPLHGTAGGIELITLAAWCATDAIVYFKKPKHPYLRWVVSYQDGTQKSLVMRADEQFSIPAKSDNPVVKLDVIYFESDKDEVANEQKN